MSSDKEKEVGYVYIPFSSYTSAQVEAWKKFLRAIKNNAPEVLVSLAQEVLPLYRPLYRNDFDGEQDYLMSMSILGYLCRYGSPHPIHVSHYEIAYYTEGIVFFPQGVLPFNYVLYMRDFLSPYRSRIIHEHISRWKAHCSTQFEKIKKDWDDEQAQQLVDKLYEWARLWQLIPSKSYWCMDYILQTLNLWCQSENTRDLDWVYNLRGIRAEPVDPDTCFEFWYPSFNIENNTFLLYERRLNEAFEAAKDEYKKRLQNLAETTEKTLTANKYQDEHFEWLVRFQVQGWSRNRIAKSAVSTSDRTTVRRGLKTTAELLGLKLRA